MRLDRYNRYVVTVTIVAALLVVAEVARAQKVDLNVIREDASSITFEATVEWHIPLSEALSRLSEPILSHETVLSLNGGVFTESRAIPLPSLDQPSVQVTAVEYDEISIGVSPSSEDLKGYLDSVPAEVISVGVERRRPTGTFVARLVTYNASAETLRRYRRIVATVQYPVRSGNDRTFQALAGVSANPHLSVSRSVLADGTWFKFPVRHEGVYRIDAEYLQSIGLSPGSIDPEHIRIYGNGGKQLPALNNAPRPVDLEEVMVYVQGGGGGSFGSGDFVAFYGAAPSGWEYNPVNSAWEHYVSPFTRDNYYFISVDPSHEGPPPTPSFPDRQDVRLLSEFEAMFFINPDLENLGQEGSGSGLDWLGPRIDVNVRERTVLDTLVANLRPGPVRIRTRVAARSNPAATLVYHNSQGELSRISPGAVTLQGIGSQTGFVARPAVSTFGFDGSPGSPLRLELRLDGTANNPQGWLDWIEVRYPSRFNAVGDFLRFTTPSGESGVFEMRLNGFSGTPQVWDITDHSNMQRLGVQPDGQQYRVQVSVTEGQRPRKLIAFAPGSGEFSWPESAEGVPNQNLHGIQSYPEFVIVTPDAFRASAEALADRRREDGMTVEVVDIQQIYNEFSGGIPDMRAVRDYFKFIYDRAPDADRLLKYALLFGGGHYDFRDLGAQPGEERNQNWILTYQTDETLRRIQSYTSDDYFGLLDDNEGLWEWPAGGDAATTFERVDIGIGRFPVQTPEEAATLVDKIQHYESTETQGSWRSRYTFVADDHIAGNNLEYDLHTDNAEAVSVLVWNEFPEVNQNKIYGISYPAVTIAGGRRLPGAKEDIRRGIEDGTLVWNYSGHGGWQGLADERLFMIEDIRQLENYNRLTIFVTATCSFGKFDMSRLRSGAEELLINQRGGAVALFTTVRLVYTSRDPNIFNVGLNRQLNRYMLSRDDDGRPARLGDVIRLTKNTEPGAQSNNRKFNLLGDPTMRVGLPERDIRVTTVNDVDVTSEAVQLRALDQVTLGGEVLDVNGSRDYSFDGIVEVTVYDAPRSVTIPEEITVRVHSYEVQNDLIYRGRVRAEQGAFSAEFIVPKDISYSSETGKISLYAESSEADGYGASRQVIVGGTSDNPPDDTEGPEIDLFLNDTTFVSGGLTHPSPDLIVRLFDESGINTVGTGVGHEMLLVINDDERNAVDLSSRYVADLDSYQSGEARYSLTDLPQGRHTLSVKAWDVVNNSSTAFLDFVVAEEERLALQNVFNYPNPMNRMTRFVFEHNQPPGTPADVQIRIYTISGRPIKTIDSMEALPGGLLPAGPVQISWDGRDEDFDHIATGVYLYRLRVQVDGEEERHVAEVIERLAVIR